MTELTVIRQLLDHNSGNGHHLIRLIAPRTTLAKRRWRGVAEDGREFGFDLENPLPHGARFFAEGAKQYVLEQAPEEVLEIAITAPEEAARIAWNLGNLHFGVQITPETIMVPSDPAILQFLVRESIAFKTINSIFLPLSANSHHHDHG